ncbi:MAG: AAA family ATPase [Candidatus Aenigmatarchaeota archaeon]
MIESKIFKNEEVLSPEYLPEFLPHREQQIKHLAENLLPVAKKRIPQNTFIFGPPGTGKTASVKFVFREFENYSGIKSIYINCWDYKTIVAILSKISLDLGGFVQRRGLGKDEILERAIEICNKLDKGLVICLDEVDQLIFHDKSALYDLLRLSQYVKSHIGLIFVSNNQFVFANVEPRIRSSLNVEEMEFKPYSLLEMKDILEERAKLAFTSFESAVILLAANHAVQNGGDVRVGLECLLKAGRQAEKEGERKVKVSHIKAVLSSVNPIKPEILKEKLNLDEKIILQIVDEEKRIFTDELYFIYSNRIEYPVGERRFRDFLKHLVDIGLIKILTRKRGIRGKKRIVIKNM